MRVQTVRLAASKGISKECTVVRTREGTKGKRKAREGALRRKEEDEEGALILD